MHACRLSLTAALGLVLAAHVRAAPQEGLPEWRQEWPHDWIGLYRGADGGGLVLFPAPADPSLPALVEIESGAVRVLFAQGEDRYTFGPSLAVPEPVQGTILLERDAQGRLTGLRKQAPGGVERSFARADVRSEPLSFANAAVTLAGSLVLPEGSGPFPAVVMLHGSEAEPRAGNLGLALCLASEGIAALIFDKRGVGESVGADWQASFDEYAADARAGFQALRGRPEVDAARIGYWGHSQGAWVAALAGARTKEAAFVVLECGGALDTIQTTLWWSRRLLEARTTLTPAEIEAVLEYRQKKFDVVAGRMTLAELAPFTAQAREQAWFAHVGERLPDGRFWEANAAYDPGPALEGLGHCAVLALYAEQDDSTPSEPSVRALEAAFERAGHERCTVRVLPDANHGFFETKTGKRMEDELANLQRFVPGYPSILTDWLKDVTRR